MEKKGESNWKGPSKSHLEIERTEKNFIICYECKKLGHFKFECPDLDKTNDNKNYFKTKDKKVLISTWENLDNTLYDEEIEEEENFCLMADTTLEEFKSNLNKEKYLDVLKTLKITYCELLSNSSILSKAYKKSRKDLRNLSKDHIELKKAHRDISLSTKLDQNSKIYYTLKEKESQILLENDKVSNEHDTLIRNFKILEDKIQSLQI